MVYDMVWYHYDVWYAIKSICHDKVFYGTVQFSIVLYAQYCMVIGTVSILSL